VLLRCEVCHLVQLRDPAPDEPDPATITRTNSSTLAEHAQAFAREAVGILPERGGLIVSLASHGAHLSSHLARLGVQALVLDRSSTLVASAGRDGVRAEVVAMTGTDMDRVASTYGAADVLLDNFLLAHLRDTDEGVAALAGILAPAGIALLEVDHVVPTLAGGQFDAIRHGHFAYFSLTSLVRALERHGLRALRADSYPIYGGSLRIRIGKADGPHRPDASVGVTLRAEEEAGVTDPGFYAEFTKRVDRERSDLRHYLETARASGRAVVGYGAPARGNTLLGAAGIGPDLLPYTVDVSPAKHGRLMSTDVPIMPIELIDEVHPDEVLVLTWDIADEILANLERVRGWGGRFVIPIPRLTVR
jgi:hypothetical protein